MDTNRPSGGAPRGRGATFNPDGRFEPYVREAVDDGWEREEEPATLRTEIAFERPRSIITRNTSPDIGFDRSINPYRGCEHGCIYCYARPSHAYLGLSPGLDFETKLTAKPEAPQRLVAELARRGYAVAPIALGTNTDPYQPVEKRLKITRGILEVLQAHRHPVTVVTKGTLIERDADILGEMGRAGLARVGVSVTTLDRDLARAMEPRAAAPERRLTVIRRLTEAGCPVRAMVAPVIPALTDHEIERLLAAARDAGAVAASYVLLRLPREVGPLFRDWLETNFPGRAAAVMARVHETQGGRDYDPSWGKRMTGSGLHAELIRQRFRAAARRLGLARDLPPLRTELFQAPATGPQQLSLFPA
jgi:DNA repair photolyase